MKKLITCLVVSLSSGAVTADILHVPSEYMDIQSALWFAVAGDIVEVDAGVYDSTYDLPVAFGAPNITLRGVTDTNGTPLTVLIGCQFWGVPGSAPVLEDLHFQDGLFPIWGSGENPTFSRCLFNSVPGIASGNFYGTISSCVIQDCIMPFEITTALGSTTTFSYCLFENVNRPIKATSGSAGSIIIDNCIITDSFWASVFLGGESIIQNSEMNLNSGTLFFENATFTIVNCDFTANNFIEGSALIAVAGASGNITGCTFSNNFQDSGGAILLQGCDVVSFTGCVISGNIVAFPRWAYSGGIEIDNNSSNGTTEIPRLVDTTICNNDVANINSPAFISGTVTISDTCPENTCVGDIDGDGEVDIADLLTLIAAWGVCP